MTTGKKLAIGGGIAVGVTAYMAFVGASASWQYYLTVDECVANAATLAADRIRVSGRVAVDTLQITSDRRQAVFSLEGRRQLLPVVCPGPLPDNLAEGIDVVVQGRLDESGCLQGEKVLTRCASKYESQNGGRSSQRTARAGEDGHG